MPNKLSQFWQELKRRNVVRVITVYAGAAFVILELATNITEPLYLPEWTPTLVIAILLIGFPIAVIFSWIFDITPDGVEVTKPQQEYTMGNKIVQSIRWKIATYVSVIIIFGLLAYNLFGIGKQKSINESIDKSIAVLPFYNFSIEPDQETMSLGLTDEIINHLFRIGSFDKVSSLTSVLSYRNSGRNLPEIAQELGVNYILEGVYKKIGERLTVSAQLIDPYNDNHIWQNDYYRKYSEITKIQSDIALQIASQLQIEVSEKAKENIETSYTPNEEAYRWYSIGIKHWEEGGAPIFDFNDAIKLDPDFALAHAYYARSQLRARIIIEGYVGDSILNISKQAIDKAILLDPDLPEAHMALSEYYFYGYSDYQKALQHLEIAYQYKPTPECDYLRGDIYRRMGLWEESIGEFEKAEEQRYKSVKTYLALGETFNCIGKYDESSRYFKRLLNLEITIENVDANILGGTQLLFTSLLKDGSTDSAREVLELLKHLEYGSFVNTTAHLALMGFYDNSDFEWIMNEVSFNSVANDRLMSMSSRSSLPPMPLMLEIFDENYESALQLMPYSEWGWNGQINSDKYHPRHFFMAYVYDMMGLSSQALIYYDSARIELEAKLDEFPDDHRIFGSLGLTYAGLGDEDKAMEYGKMATEIFPLSKDSYAGLFRIEELAWIYVIVKKYDRAIEQLEILLTNPGPFSARYLQLDSRWQPLWNHPEFIRLTEK